MAPNKDDVTKTKCVPDTANAKCIEHHGEKAGVAEQCMPNKCYSAHPTICGDCSFPFIGTAKKPEGSTGCKKDTDNSKCTGEATNKCIDEKCYSTKTGWCGHNMCAIGWRSATVPSLKNGGCSPDGKDHTCHKVDSCMDEGCWELHPDICATGNCIPG